MVTFLPQSRPEVPDLELKGLDKLGDTIAGGIQQNRRRNDLAAVAAMAKQGASTEELATALASSRDGDLATLGLQALQQARARSEDMSFRREGRQMAQANADRSFGLQERQFAASQANAARPSLTTEQKNFKFAQENPGFNEFLNRNKAGGNFYAVQTGAGTMLLDKRSGTAVMMGVDDSGNPVQIGQPFTPEFTENGTPIPVPSGSVQAQAPAVAKPMMAPSIDPAAQGAVAAAKAKGTAEGKREGELPELRTKAQSAMGELERSHAVVDQEIERALDMADAFSTGFFSGIATVPGTDAHDLRNTLNTIKANIGFDKLQAMRDASPTGGALGQVSDQENRLLQSTLGSLEQSQTAGQLRANLIRLKGILTARATARREAFEADFGGNGGSASAPRAGQTSSGVKFRIK